MASVAFRVRWSDGENQMWPISMTPCSGAIRMKLAMPSGVPVSVSTTAKKSGSVEAARWSSQVLKSSKPMKGP